MYRIEILAVVARMAKFPFLPQLVKFITNFPPTRVITYTNPIMLAVGKFNDYITIVHIKYEN